MDTITRKVHCYNVMAKLNLNDILDAYIERLNNDYTKLEERKMLYSGEKDNFKYFMDIQKVESVEICQDGVRNDSCIYNCTLYKLRSTDFPYLFDLMTGNKEKINASINQSIMEQTHFILIPNSGIIISEYNHQGPRITKFINIIHETLEVKYSSGLNIVPIFNAKTIDKIRNLKGIKSMNFKAGHQGLRYIATEMKIKGLDALMGTFSNDNELEFEIIIKGKGRSKQVEQEGLKQNVERLFNSMTKAKSNKVDLGIKKAKIDEFESESDYPIDLLEQYLVQEVTVCKLDDRYKYLNSEDMFNQLFKLYNKNSFKLDKFKSIEKVVVPKEAVAIDKA